MDEGEKAKGVLVDILSEFLEVFVHLVLYTREIYPKETFTRKTKYNTTVQVSRHSGVCEYVSALVRDVKDILSADLLEKVVVCIHDENEKVLEKFVLEFSDLKQCLVAPKPNKQGNSKPRLDLEMIEGSLRDFVIKLNSSVAVFKDSPPEGSSFMVLVHTNSPVQGGEQWNNINPRRTEVTSKSSASRDENAGQAQLIPFKSCRIGGFRMQLYVETIF